MSEPIVVYVPGPPIPKARPRLGKGYVYTPERTVSFEAAVGLYARRAMNGDQPYDCPFEAHLQFVFDPPPSWSKKKQRDAVTGLIDCTTHGDIDNFTKAALDGCNHIVYVDDRQVVKLIASKHYGPKSGTFIKFIPRIHLAKENAA